MIQATKHALMNTYVELRTASISRRAAAMMTPIPRSTATRPHRFDSDAPRRRSQRPVNRLRVAKRAKRVEVLTSDRFVDHTPIQVFAALLDQGSYLRSISTMYRILPADRLLVQGSAGVRRNKLAWTESHMQGRL